VAKLANRVASKATATRFAKKQLQLKQGASSAAVGQTAFQIAAPKTSQYAAVGIVNPAVTPATAQFEELKATGNIRFA